MPRPQVRDDRVVPVRQQPRGHVAQRLSPRPGLRRDDCVAGIGKLGVPGAVSEPGRRGVVKPAPRHALPLAGLHQHLGLVPALQRAVVIGVQPPGPPDRDPVPVTLGQGEVRSADRPALHGGVHQARQQPVRSQQPARLYRFSLPSLGQRHVHPAGKQIPGVPLALTMTQQNQAVAATRRLPHARVPVRASATPRTSRTAPAVAWPSSRWRRPARRRRADASCKLPSVFPSLPPHTAPHSVGGL